MAKLSARGRVEVARFVKSVTVTDSDSVSARRHTQTLMSDGAILGKDDSYFKQGQYLPAGWHSYGWKLYGKLAKDALPSEWIGKMGKSGWVKV